jgi:mRNA-degrading endonuclease toxin of MazEF toxin-antitoxin module
MNRGEIYRTKEKITEHGNKPGFYVVVSRDFLAENQDILTVICAPIYSEILGIRSEVVLDESHSMAHSCAIRCDFLMLMFKHKLTQFVARLPPSKILELNAALVYALDLSQNRGTK